MTIPSLSPSEQLVSADQRRAGGSAPQTSIRLLTRRRLLEAAGGIVVVLVGGTLYRAYDQGVFSTGDGPAYQAWRDFSAQDGPPELKLVRAGVLATNAHNTQPWLFRLSPGRIDLYAIPSRNTGSLDPLRREMYLSLGCALENLSLAAPAQGLVPTVDILPDPADETFVARVDLAPGTRVSSPLYEAIPVRHTNRAAYADRAVTPETLQAMEALIDLPEVGVLWFTSGADKQTFADVTLRATEAIIADPVQAADDFAWYRTNWSELQSHKDGLSLDGSGVSPLLRIAGKLLPVSREQSDSGWLTATRDTQLPTAAAFGMLVVHDARDNAQRLQAGRIWQRLHLWAMTQGLAMQPLNQMVERAEREQTANLAPEFTRAVAAMIPNPLQAIMPFRIGYPTQDALLSPRRPAEEVVEQLDS